MTLGAYEVPKPTVDVLRGRLFELNQLEERIRDIMEPIDALVSAQIAIEDDVLDEIVPSFELTQHLQAQKILRQMLTMIDHHKKAIMRAAHDAGIDYERDVVHVRTFDDTPF